MGVDFKLPKSPSKEDESLLLRAVAAYLTEHGDNYLASLFSPQFVGWVEAQIRSDFSPDMWGWLQKAHEETGQAKATYHGFKLSSDNQISRLELRISSLQQDLAKAQDEIAAERNRTYAARSGRQGEIDDRDRRIQSLINTQGEMYDKNFELETEIRRLKDALANLAVRITEGAPLPEEG